LKKRTGLKLKQAGMKVGLHGLVTSWAEMKKRTGPKLKQAHSILIFQETFHLRKVNDFEKQKQIFPGLKKF
jgi:hypothetical protein